MHDLHLEIVETVHSCSPQEDSRDASRPTFESGPTVQRPSRGCPPAGKSTILSKIGFFWHTMGHLCIFLYMKFRMELRDSSVDSDEHYHPDRAGSHTSTANQVNCKLG